MNIDEKIKKLQSDISTLEDRKKVLSQTNIDVDGLLLSIKKQIGETLKEKRTEKNISKSLLSELSHVSRMTISRAEKGESLLGIDSIVRICLALKCDFDEIVQIYIKKEV